MKGPVGLLSRGCMGCACCNSYVWPYLEGTLLNHDAVYARVLLLSVVVEGRMALNLTPFQLWCERPHCFFVHHMSCQHALSASELCSSQHIVSRHLAAGCRFLFCGCSLAWCTCMHQNV
jgi:hypothetical protein